MITKLVLKILLKAAIPLCAVVGIASYALYAAGGDPISVLKQVGGGFGERVSALSRSAGSSIDSARKKTTSTFSNDEPGKSQTLYRWKDADGITHFSSTPPDDGAQADTLNIDPNRNLVSAPKRQHNEAKASNASQMSGQVNGQIDGDLPENMPGISGILTPGMNPAQMISKFKQAQEDQKNRMP